MFIDSTLDLATEKPRTHSTILRTWSSSPNVALGAEDYSDDRKG